MTALLSLMKILLQFLTRKRKREAEERTRYPLERRIKEAIIGQEGAVMMTVTCRNIFFTLP